MLEGRKAYLAVVSATMETSEVGVIYLIAGGAGGGCHMADGPGSRWYRSKCSLEDPPLVTHFCQPGLTS